VGHIATCATHDLLLKHQDATFTTYIRRQIKHLNYASETFVKRQKKNLKTIANNTQNPDKTLATYL
jgi:hypothetical protein